jgi:hypothetical protein
MPLGRWSHSLAVVAAADRFRVDNVRSGDYRISTTDLPVGFYLKDARLSERDGFNAPSPPSQQPFSAFAEGRTYFRYNLNAGLIYPRQRMRRNRRRFSGKDREES